MIGWWRRRSFRLRLVVISACVSGVVLVAYSAAVSYFARRQLLNQLDGRLSDLGQRIAVRIVTDEEWFMFRQIAAAMEMHFQQEFDYPILAKRISDQAVTFRSRAWPDGLAGASAPALAESEVNTQSVPPWERKAWKRDRVYPPVSLRRKMELADEPRFGTEHHETGTWRIGVFANPRSEVYVALSMDGMRADVRRIHLAFLLAFPVALLMIGSGAWLTSGRALAPIRAIRQTASSITGDALNRRVPRSEAEDELGRLVDVVNAMLERLESNFHQATRFSADASHELKTPLTIIRAQVESALDKTEAGTEEEIWHTNLLQEIQRLNHIVSSLLLLSRADSGKIALSLQSVDLKANIEAICEDTEIRAEAFGIKLHRTIEPGIEIIGDENLLQPLIQNLFSNALKYNHSAGEICCELKRVDDAALLTISNTGPGISEANRHKIFRRFHRGDEARSRDIDGYGLGLNIALEIAKAHGGTLELVESTECITRIQLRLPLRRD